MNTRLLIDKLVHQTSVLLGQLATSGGVRAPVANIANQVFLDLAQELDAQGVSRKVSSDMFGMALRAYLKKIQRLTGSSTDEGRSLWEAVFDYIAGRPLVNRAEVMQRFHRDDEMQLRGVLFDLVESGLITTKGSGLTTEYRASESEEARFQSAEALAELLWAVIFREGPISYQALSRRGGQRKATFEQALQILMGDGRIHVDESSGQRVYESKNMVITMDSKVGWEAAVFDHYHALVRTICQTLRGDSIEGVPRGALGGFTYSLDIWPEHPFADEVYRALQESRSRFTELRRRIDEYNAEHGRKEPFQEVVIYGGQSILLREDKLDGPPPSKPAGD